MEVPAAKIGKEIRANGARIVGVVSCVPSQKIGNDYFVEKFGKGPTDDIVKMIGVNQRRWVDENTTTSDLCKIAGHRLLAGLGWDPETVDALIFVSQTPDFRLPASACVLQDGLCLSTSCIAFDVNLGCSAYPYALWLGMMMIQSGAAKRVLLAVGETSSKLVNPDDRSTAMLFGDAGTVTALEASSVDDHAYFVLGTDGRGAQNLIVPVGGSRAFSAQGNTPLALKDPLFLYMDGGEIFNFTLRTVPPLLKRTMEFAGRAVDSYDAFLFHQANLFMLKHLVKKMKLPDERVPINIDNFGNTSSASVPLLMTTLMKQRLAEQRLELAMFGFGVGYSWSSASISVGPLKIVEMLEI